MSFPDTGFRLDRARSATSQVFEHLRELIVSLAVPPGTVLARPQLCAYFGLSQAPIREALLRLEEERLIDIFPQHQTRVRGIDLASARQAHFLRLSVEIEMARTLAQRPNPGLEASLLALVAGQRACLAGGDLAGFARLDIEFHRRLYEAADLLDLWAMMRSASGNLDRLRRMHLPLKRKAESIIEQHASIAQRIGAGDSAGAQETVRVHLSGTLNALDALRERYPDLMLPAGLAPPALAA